MSWYGRRARCGLLAVMGVGLALPAFSHGNVTKRVSVASDGTESNKGCVTPAISANGRFVAFRCFASNLVVNDTNQTDDIFVHDRKTGVTERVSVASNGAQANNESEQPTVSGNGRFVAFKSFASNLVVNDTNEALDVFVHDRKTGVTERVSVASNGAQANSSSLSPAISANGRFVAFVSNGTNLVERDTNDWMDVFVHDRKTGLTERVSVASDGTQANFPAIRCSISATGRFVAFDSPASNLVPNDTNQTYDIFVHDRKTGVTERVNVGTDGTQVPPGTVNADPSISANGRYVAFVSDASNLVTNDTNATLDVFVYDRKSGRTTRVSVASDGEEGNNFAFSEPAISGNGRYVAFASEASNLVPGDTNGKQDIFVYDRLRRTTERVNVASDGDEATDVNFWPAISNRGRQVVFYSNADNLVPGDTNNAGDIFVRIRAVNGLLDDDAPEWVEPSDDAN